MASSHYIWAITPNGKLRPLKVKHKIMDQILRTKDGSQGKTALGLLCVRPVTVIPLYGQNVTLFYDDGYDYDVPEEEGFPELPFFSSHGIRGNLCMLFEYENMMIPVSRCKASDIRNDIVKYSISHISGRSSTKPMLIQTGNTKLCV